MQAPEIEPKIAYAIDSFDIWIPCNCKRGYHVHGSGGDFSNRVTSRIGHGMPECKPYSTIIINDTTLRTTVVSRGPRSRKWKTSAKQFELMKTKKVKFDARCARILALRR